GVYTVPASIASQQTVTVTATSSAAPAQSASATITLNPPVAVGMSPPSIALNAGQTQQFAATVTGTSNTQVSWSLSGAGSLTSAGLYTAPATIASQQTVTVTATSSATPAQSPSATIT